MEGFRINCDQVLRQAKIIEDLSNNLEREIQKIENIAFSINSNWKGPASTDYQKHLSMLIADLKKTKSEMVSVSSKISNAARIIQQEDERQEELAKQMIII